jgi:hypothetical protein
MTTRIDRFRELIAEPPAPLPPEQTSELVQPLRDLAQVLREKAAVDADVQASDDGRRYHLALWPLHRPAFRSIMVTVAVESGRMMVLQGNQPWLQLDPDELTSWLERLMLLPMFRAALDDLRARAREPVDARLESENGMATLVQLSPEEQERLHACATGGEMVLDALLPDRERVPDPKKLQRLNSAGVRFRIDEADLKERRLHLRMVKLR